MFRLTMAVEGLDIPSEVIGLNAEAIERAAYRAINATAERARKMSADEIRRQVNFPAAYLYPSAGRLTIPIKAGPGDLQAAIAGRQRPTSLARFVTRGKVGKMGVDVAVKPGQTQTMKRAFLMKLKSGANGIDTSNNLGLAIRTEAGKRPTGAYKPVRITDNLYLLYGPSVDQVFKSVRGDVSPDAGRYLETEFERLLAYELRK